SSNGPAASTLALTTAAPSFGNAVTLSVSDPPIKGIQELSLTCSQHGHQVYLDVHTEKNAAWTQFMLWSQPWADNGGGAASCTASLFYYTWRGKTETGVVNEAQTTFVAG